MTHQDNAAAMVEEAEELTDALRTQVLFAREYLKSVEIGPKQVGDLHLCGWVSVMHLRVKILVQWSECL